MDPPFARRPKLELCSLCMKMEHFKSLSFREQIHISLCYFVSPLCGLAATRKSAEISCRRRSPQVVPLAGDAGHGLLPCQLQHEFAGMSSHVKERLNGFKSSLWSDSSLMMERGRRCRGFLQLHLALSTRRVVSPCFVVGAPTPVSHRELWPFFFFSLPPPRSTRTISAP